MNFAEYNDFGRYNGTQDQRLFIHIENPETEVVYFGFSSFYTQPHWPNEGSSVNGYFRIKDPSGNVVWPTAGNANGQLNNSAISTWQQAVNGPNQIVGSGGYNAYTFNPDGMPAGDYYIEFSAIQGAYSSTDLVVPYYDITVATEGTPTAIDGRVFAYNWAFMTPRITSDSFDRNFSGKMFIYSDDGFVSNIDFSQAQFQGAAFNIAFNSTGTGNTNNFDNDRASVQDVNATYAEYRVFLNNPDINVYPNGTFGEFVFNADFPKLYGCPDDGQWFFRFAATQAGRVEILIDSDNDNEFDPGTADRLLSLDVIPFPGEVAPYERDIAWNGLNGLGVPIPTNTNLSLEYSYSQGFYHLPVYDVEHLRTGLSVNSVRPVTPQPYNPKFFYDDEAISETLPGGQPALQLNGCTPPCHYWTATDYGNVNTINTFWYAYRSEVTVSIPFETPPPTCAGCPFTPFEILGNVFHDANQNGVQDNGEQGYGNVTINVYNDANGNGIYNPGTDPLIDTDNTDGSGNYALQGLIATKHLVRIDQLDLPVNSTMTTASLFAIEFFSLFDASCDNAFGFVTFPIANTDYDTIPDTSVPLVVCVQNNDVDPLGNGLVTSIVTPPVNGGTAVVQGICIQYTAIPNYIGVDSLQYQICTSEGLCDTAWVIIQIGDICGDGIDNDGDGLIDNYSPQIVIVAGGTDPYCSGFSDGTLTGGATGGRAPYIYTWYQNGSPIAVGRTLLNRAAGTYILNVEDANGCKEERTVILRNNNCPPVANNDFLNTLVSTPVSGNVLTNDFDLNGDNLITNTTPIISPTHGSVVINANGTFTYTPNPGFSGDDSFVYRICDDGTPSLCDEAVVYIEIIPISAGNDPPIANADNAVTYQGIPVTGNVLVNDDDPDGDNIILNTTPITPPSNGIVVLQPNGSFLYTPNPTFIGTDTYIYSICDDGTPSLCDTTIVTINVLPDATPDNQPPFAGNDGAVTPMNTPVSGDMLGNDSDPDGDNITINTTPYSNPTNGTVVINPDGTFDYTPNNGFTGTDVFSYLLCDDGTPSLCDVADVTIVVTTDNPGNQPPIAQNDQAQTNQDVPVSGSVIPNDGDPDGDPLTVNTTPASGPANGSVVLSPNGDYTYTPNPGFNGTDVFVYSVCDNGSPALCDEATVTIVVLPPFEPGNDPPFAGDDAALTPQGTPVGGDLLANDFDPNGDNITINTTPVVGVSNGTLTINPDGTYDYTPNPTFIGTDQFVYRICDDGTPVLCATATCVITVYPDNNPPVATDDMNSTLVNVPVSGNVTTNDWDPDGDNLTVTTTPLIGPSHGSVILNPNGSYTYTPNPGFNGEDSFTYVTCDDGVPSLCDTAEVSIEVIPVTTGNEPPVAQDDAAQTQVDVPVTGNVLVNDDDPDGDNIILNLTPLTGPNNGTVTLLGNGTFTYTPNPGFEGTDVFTYSICDDQIPSLCDTAEVTIVVIPDYNGPDNDPPFAGDDAALTPQEVPVSGQLLTNDYDVNGDNIIINTTQISGPTNGSVLINSNGTYTYTPNLGFTGPDQFVYQICDDGVPSLCAQATCYITVYPDNNPPIAVNDFNNTLVNTPVSGSVITNDFDPDGDNISVNPAPVSGPSNGSVSLLPNGNYTYTPNPGFSGEDSFVYSICDNGIPQLCDNAVVTISVIPVTVNNDPPVANPDAYVTQQGVPVGGNILVNDDDPDGDAIILNTTPLTGPSNGTVTVAPNGNIVYTPNFSFTGEDTFTYSICDNGSPVLCDQTTVTIIVLPDFNGPNNDPPFAGDDAALTPMNVPVSGQLLTNDFDPNGDNIIINTSPISGPSHGTVTINANGTYTYTPAPGYIGPDQYVYQICDDGFPVLCARATCYITVFPGPGISFVITEPLCNGQSNGSINITVSNATAPLTYSWSNGATTEDLTNVPAGTYVVTVTDAQGSILQQTIQLTQPAVVSVVVDVQDETIVNGCNGSATANPAGGTSPYTYLWSNGQTTQTATNLCAGIYQVTVTDANGCPVTTSRIINPPSCDLDVNVTGQPVGCNGGSNGSVLATPITAQNHTPYTYLWNTGATTQQLTGVTAGPYSVMVTDAIGCTASGSFTVTQPPLLGANTSVIDEQTFGGCNGSATATATGGTSPFLYSWSNGSIGQTATGLCPGNYTVTITDARGCIVTRTITVNALSCTGFAVQVNTTSPTCFGLANGGAIAVVSGGTAPFTYFWPTGGSTASSLTGLGAGTFTVQVTDAVNCLQTASGVVTQPALLQAATAVDPVTCHGLANGAIELTVTGGTTPYTYTWSNAATTEDLNNLGPGNYGVSIHDANGCAVSASGVVTQPDTLGASSINTNVTCFGGSDGAIDLTATGGLPPYQYSWSNAQTTADISGLTQGNYSVTFVDQNACVYVYSTSITQAGQFVPTITPSGPTTFCAGGQVVLTATAGNSYLWSNGATTQAITVTNTGVFSVNVITAQGCSGNSANVQVTVNPNPVPTVSPVGSTTFCQGGSVTLTTGSYASYLWSTGATTQSINVTTSGSYTVTVTNGNGCVGTSAPRVITVNPLPTPTVTANGPTTFCQGSNVVLTASAANAYLWSTGATTQSITVTTAGTFTVTVTDGNGCQGTSAPITTTRNSNPTPTVTPDGPTIFCSGDSVVLASSVATSYLWSTGATTQSITVFASGNYTVTVTDANGCQGASAPTSVTVNNNPTPTITAGGDLEFCDGDSVVLTSSLASSYLWSTGATTRAITVYTTGEYAVTVTNASGCSGTSDTVDVVVNNNPTPTIAANGPTEFCAGGNVELTASSGGTYLWNTGATGQTITVTTSGMRWVTVTSGSGCSGISDTVNVVVNPNPTPTITPDGPLEFCNGDSVTLTASAATSYLWSNGATTQSTVVYASGTYHLTVTDANGCSGAASPVTVVVNQLPFSNIFATGPVSFCEGDSVDLVARQSAGYLWTTGETTRIITVSTSGTYSVISFDANGCQSESNEITVTVHPNPVPTISASGPLVFCDGGTVVLSASVAIPTGSINYAWNTFQTSPSITVSDSGSYWVTVTIDNGCTGTSDTINVDTWDLPEPHVTTVGLPSFCAGDTIFLTTTEEFESYLWTNTGDTTRTTYAVNTGFYTVLVTDTNGCQGLSPEDLLTVNVNPTPTTTPDGTIEICDGDTITITSVMAESYLWTTGDTTQAIHVYAAGTYNITATDANGCTGTSSDVIVIVNQLPNPSIVANGDLDFCAGGQVTLSTQNFETYLWSTGAIGQNITVNQSGSYTVTVTDSTGCASASAIADVTVHSNPTPTIAVTGPQQFCFGDSVVLTATAGFNGYEWSNGATTQSITVYTSGSFNVTVTDENGCQGTSPLKTIEVYSLPIINIIANGPIEFCAGDSVTLTATGGLNYLWSNGATTQSITVHNAGSYFVYGNNQFGCYSTSSSVSVLVNNPPVVTVFPDGPTQFCDGGSVGLNANGADNFLWSTGETGTGITVSTSGLYSVIGTNANGCSTETGNIQVTVYPNPVPVITPNGPTEFCTGDSVVLTSSDAASYLWSTNATTQSITVFTSGLYTVSVVDSNGCEGLSARVTVVVNPNPVPTITADGLMEFCDGDSVMLTSSTFDSYVWSTGDTTQSIVVYSSGDYSVEVADQNGCSGLSANATVTVYQNPIPEITASDRVVCDGQIVTLTASQSSEYLWNTGANSQTISVTANGVYSLVVTDANGCMGTDSVDIRVNPTPTPVPVITANGSTTFCAGDSVNLEVDAWDSYLWSTGDTTQSIWVDESGLYIVTVTNEFGCAAASAGEVVTVNNNPMPAIQANGDSAICDGESITLNTGIFNTYLWSTGDTTQFITVDSTGTYFVTVTNGDGCSAMSSDFEVVENPLPQVSIDADGPTTICLGGEVTLSAVGNGPYLWSNGATTQSILVTIAGTYFVQATDTVTGCVGVSDDVAVEYFPFFNPDITTDGPTAFCDGEEVVLTATEGTSYLWSTQETTQSITVSVTGVYTVTVVDTNGCSGTTGQTVTVLPAPLTEIIPDSQFPYCQGDVITLTALGVPFINDFEWSTGETIQSIEVTQSGVYTVTVTNLLGCSATASLPIGFLPTPTAQISVSGGSSICEGDYVTLTASGLPFGNTYLWSNGQTGQSITVSAAGTFTVTVTNFAGCSATSEPVSIDVVPGPTANAGQDAVICIGDTVVLVGSGGDNTVWTPGGTSPSISVSPFDDTMYLLSVTNDGCNQVATDTVWVYTQAYPNAAFGYGETNLGEPVLFTDSSTVQPLFSWDWNFGDGNSSNEQNPSNDYEEAGEYEVTLIVSTSAGCTDTTSTVISVEELFIITNVLTPNGDGINDYIWITSSLADLIEAQIYNRWGLSVWEGVGTDLRFAGKTSEGVDLPAGTYYYTVALNYGDAGTKELSGYITLIRN
ncbi:MAG: tandem-95 repeat protein [Flavobacteriales bacterium]|nr:tandem-95 repeat protein [Flavobacteriales bacterium]